MLYEYNRFSSNLEKSNACNNINKFEISIENKLASSVSRFSFILPFCSHFYGLFSKVTIVRQIVLASRTCSAKKSLPMMIARLVTTKNKREG